jgi:DNA repair photolyase
VADDYREEMPFDFRDGRVMVSLGPLTNKRYCTYRCPFCYVSANFKPYATMDIAAIVSWIKDIPENDYDVIYVSGDTDSFAPPRTEQGLALLRAISEIPGPDILFTTRALFSQGQIDELSNLREQLSLQQRRLFGCVSIAQWSMPHLEPRPIASPLQRAAQLGRFKDAGLISVLAMRPFLPNVPREDYNHILESTVENVHVVLGEVWYADKEGFLESRVFRGEAPEGIEYSESTMPFDGNNATWRVYELPEIQRFAREWCEAHEIPFFMRSRPAIQWVRDNVPF